MSFIYAADNWYPQPVGSTVITSPVRGLHFSAVRSTLSYTLSRVACCDVVGMGLMLMWVHTPARFFYPHRSQLNKSSPSESEGTSAGLQRAALTEAPLKLPPLRKEEGCGAVSAKSPSSKPSRLVKTVACPACLEILQLPCILATNRHPNSIQRTLSGILSPTA